MPIFDANNTDGNDNATVVLYDSSGNAIGQATSNPLVVDIGALSATDWHHVNRVDVASGARTVSGNSGILDTKGLACLTFLCDVTAVTGTNAEMDFYLESSDDQSLWNLVVQTRRFTGVDTQRFQRISVSAKYYRYRWEISGTNPSFTFSVTTTLKAYLPRRFANKIQYDFDLTQAVGSVSEVFSAADSPYVSLITIRGNDNGSGAQYEVQVSNDRLGWASITGAISQNKDTQIASSFEDAYRFYRLKLTAQSNEGVRVMDIFWACTG